MAVNYVKFFRGSSLAFENVIKNTDTLYFISDSDSNKSSLYLGDKLIASNITELADLNDFLLSELNEGQILTYDETNQAWVNKAAIDAIGLMVGATSQSQGNAGLVPAPGMGQQKMFLRGDGTWATPGELADLSVDGKSLEATDGSTISLKDYGKRYYKYVATSGSEETGDYVAAHYELQEVDAEHPWAIGLEPKVTEENGELVLGWFEPNQTTFEGVLDTVTSLQGETVALSQKVQRVQTSINEIETDMSELETKLNKKADVNSVYTKDETDTKINEAVTAAGHLKRKIFDTFDEAVVFVQYSANPADFIYMIKSDPGAENNLYDEYLYVEDVGLEKVGSWTVDLSDYVTETELTEGLNKKVDAVSGSRLITDDEARKLTNIEEGAQKNLFSKVNENNFSITTTDEGALQLDLINVNVNQVNNLQTLLDGKATQNDITNLSSQITNISGAVDSVGSVLANLDTRVVNIEKSLNNPNNYVTKEEYAADMEQVMNAITWNNLDTPGVY